jgi:hypothetical protein
MSPSGRGPSLGWTESRIAVCRITQLVGEFDPSDTCQCLLLDRLDFDWLFIQCRTIEDSACQDVLVETLFANSISQNEVKRALCLVIHRLASSGGCDAHSRDIFFLLSSIIKKAKSLLPSTDVDSLKEYVFLQSQFITGVSMSEKLTTVLFEGELRLQLPNGSTLLTSIRLGSIHRNHPGSDVCCRSKVRCTHHCTLGSCASG